MLRCKKLDKNAFLPSKANEKDAGYDLYSLEDYVIHYGEIVKVKTGIAIEMPPAPPGYNSVGLIFDRSSMGSKGIIRLAGVIDQEYRGEIIICLSYIKNTWLNYFKRLFGYRDCLKIKKGDRIAQLLIFDVRNYKVIEVNELSNSVRGDKGFGSSGI